MGLSEGVQKDLAMYILQRELQKRVSPHAPVSSFEIDGTLELLFDRLSITIKSCIVVFAFLVRFGLSSKESGVIVSANDVVAVCIVLFVGYFGEKINKAKYISPPDKIIRDSLNQFLGR